MSHHEIIDLHIKFSCCCIVYLLIIRTVIYKYECVNHLCKHSYVILSVNDAI